MPEKPMTTSNLEVPWKIKTIGLKEGTYTDLCTNSITLLPLKGFSKSPRKISRNADYIEVENFGFMDFIGHKIN